MTILSFGQNKGTIKFLGIPIDGTETQFATKLKAKGFTYNTYSESYKGQFNGKNVDVYIHTNHNLVDRVYVAFPQTASEDQIRNEYNRLLSQFKDTGKYMDLSFNEEIPADEDISYQITVKNKRYQASLCYFDPDREPLPMIDALLDKFTGIIPDDALAKMKEFTKEAINLPEDQQKELSERLMAELQAMGYSQDPNAEPDPEKTFLFLSTFIDGMKSLADGDVWFMIHEHYGRYNIGLYYDNLHNQAHGEDL